MKEKTKSKSYIGSILERKKEKKELKQKIEIEKGILKKKKKNDWREKN